MKNTEVLFLAIGGLEAGRLEKTEFQSKACRASKKRFFLIAAIIALTLLLVGCAVAVYTRIHAKVTQYDIPTATVSPNEDPDTKNIFTSCYPQKLPAGYLMTGGYPTDRFRRNISYSNENGTSISFTISSNQTDNMLDPSAESTKVTVSGWEGTLQVSESGARAIFWHNEVEAYYAVLYTEDKNVDLQAMAESVTFGKPLPLKQTNQELYFTYESYVSDAASPEAVAQMCISGETPAETYTIQGCPGAGAVVGYSTKTTEVAWVQGTAEKGICFQLISPDYSVEELLQIAESIQKQ